MAGDRLGSVEDAPSVAPGRLVVADAAHVHGLLFGEVAVEHQVGPRSERVTFFSVGVDGVPAIHVEEALWIVLEVMGPG